MDSAYKTLRDVVIGHGRRCPNLNCLIMHKLIIHETRVQGTWLSGSKSRCSISSRDVVLSNDGKKKRRRRLCPIFKSVGKVILKIIVAIGAIAELALLVVNWLCW